MVQPEDVLRSNSDYNRTANERCCGDNYTNDVDNSAVNFESYVDRNGDTDDEHGDNANNNRIVVGSFTKRDNSRFVNNVRDDDDNVTRASKRPRCVE